MNQQLITRNKQAFHQQATTASGKPALPFYRLDDQVLQALYIIGNHGFLLQKKEPDVSGDTETKESLANPRFTSIHSLLEIAEGKKVLTAKDNGKPVKAVQTALLDIGYSLLRYKDDGKLGDETRQAVRAFREDQTLGEADDGKYDTFDYLAMFILDEKAPPPGTSEEHYLDYERLLEDNKLEFSISVGYDEGQSHIATAESGRRWLEDKSFKLISGSQETGDELYETKKDITYPDKEGQMLTRNISVTVRLITPGPGGAKRFLDSLNTAEIATYTGHARGGLGPDFDDKHSGDENVVIGAHSKLHDKKDSSVKTPTDPYWKSVSSPKVNTLEQLKESGSWDEKKYRIWLFYACSSYNYLDEFRGGLLPANMNRKNLDIFGTNLAVPIAGRLRPTFAMIEGIMAGQTMEQIVRSMQQNLEEALKADPSATPAVLKTALKTFKNSFFREGAADNQKAPAATE